MPSPPHFTAGPRSTITKGQIVPDLPALSTFMWGYSIQIFSNVGAVSLDTGIGGRGLGESDPL